MEGQLMNVFNKILENKEKSFHKEQKEKNEDEPKVCPASSTPLAAPIPKTTPNAPT